MQPSPPPLPPGLPRATRWPAPPRQCVQEQLGARQYARLWSRLKDCTARALSAAQAALVEATAWLGPSLEEYGFQMLGVDYLVDRDLRPWLLEFNSAPSTMVVHANAGARRLIHDQKAALLRDMLALVRHRVFAPATKQRAGGQGTRGDRATDSAKAESVAVGTTEFELLQSSSQ